MIRMLIALPLLLLTGGCGVLVPDKFEVTDGIKFTTYSNDGKENMLGYNFVDADSGDMVMPRSYRVRTIAVGGMLDRDDPAAREYLADRRRRRGDSSGKQAGSR
jgi:hypothetical protein